MTTSSNTNLKTFNQSHTPTFQICSLHDQPINTSILSSFPKVVDHVQTQQDELNIG